MRPSAYFLLAVFSAGQQYFTCYCVLIFQHYLRFIEGDSKEVGVLPHFEYVHHFEKHVLEQTAFAQIYLQVDNVWNLTVE